jgi:hypothetical protein
VSRAENFSGGTFTSIGENDVLLNQGAFYAAVTISPKLQEVVSNDGTVGLDQQDRLAAIQDGAIKDPYLKQNFNEPAIRDLTYGALDYVLAERLDGLNKPRPELSDEYADREKLHELLRGYASGQLDAMPLVRQDVEAKCRDALLSQACMLDDSELELVAMSQETTAQELVELLEQHVFGIEGGAPLIPVATASDADEIRSGYIVNY